MNVRRMIEHGERFLKEGEIELGLQFLRMAYAYINQVNPSGREDLIAICCFSTLSQDGDTLLVHCGEDDKHMLFPGTPEERKQLCFACQQWCLQKIQELQKDYQA